MIRSDLMPQPDLPEDTLCPCRHAEYQTLLATIERLHAEHASVLTRLKDAIEQRNSFSPKCMPLQCEEIDRDKQQYGQCHDPVFCSASLQRLMHQCQFSTVFLSVGKDT